MIELAQASLIISIFISFSVYCSKSIPLRAFKQYGRKHAINLQIFYVFIYSFIYNFILLFIYFDIIQYESILFKLLFVFFVIIANTAIILSDSKDSIIEIIYTRVIHVKKRETEGKDE